MKQWARLQHWHPTPELEFESQLLPTNAPGKEDFPPMWEIHMEFLAPSYSLTQPQLLWSFRE